MLRIVLFLVIIALAAAGAAWVADQPGEVVLSWNDWKASMTLPVFALVIGAGVVAVMLAWAIILGVVRAPSWMKRGRSSRRSARARNAITQGLLAVGHGDSSTARLHASAARRHAPHDPLALLLQAQSAQLEGDREGARRAFLAMAARKDTKSLGMRGLYIEAQRADDPYAALAIAEEALRVQPNCAWASQAVLGFRCARSDWTGALEILERNLSAGLIDKKAFRRQRAVLLTARAIDLEESDESLARDSALEANKLAPTLVPAAVLAAKYLAEAHQVRRAMKVIEAAWQAQPHPDLASTYANLKPGDTATARLGRVENLVGKGPQQLESALAIARAAIDAGSFSRARTVLQPYLDMPTQRVAMLMAEIEHGDRGDTAKARAWTLRAVRALHDPVWTADGYVSDHWRPVSPVTGRLDAFQWQVPVSALPSSKAVVVDDKFHDALIASSAGETLPASTTSEAVTVTVEAAPEAPIVAPKEPTAVLEETAKADKPAKTTEAPAEAVAPPAASSSPLFHRRKEAAPVIPIVRAPDDPGVDEDAAPEEFPERAPTTAGQSSGWRGYRPPR
ncbi:heme biosynthesis protein HemY [Rhodopseudomonas palustris]|uniref:heme biosynthesis protein HemY n=1 Tax=Rhodopseudomonas palustris TaxID=1076 RepID=UPI000E5B54A3|nr:heme biosynthesis HemY N-terminal domain-containing protein [Rhodopseudomonas palustris]QLH69477.1 tetratricopeptide repeat protein [Rhodopseudomonas palustris]RIA03264.1 heme biosynthesis protein HemY [Rhodopseudomonas palustris]